MSVDARPKEYRREYAVTFGQKYRTKKHPYYDAAHPDGWVTIEAPSREEARKAAKQFLGEAWCDLYLASEFEKELYPLGELHRVVYVAR